MSGRPKIARRIGNTRAKDRKQRRQNIGCCNAQMTSKAATSAQLGVGNGARGKNDNKVPVPFSVFPSTYRSDAASEKTEIKVDERVDLSSQRQGREGHESRYESSSAYRQGPRSKTTRYEVDIDEKRRSGRHEEDIHIYSEDRRAPRDAHIEIEETRFKEPYSRHIDAHIDIGDRRFETEIDTVEREYRQRTVPFSGDYAGGWEDKSTSPRQTYDRDLPAEENVKIHTETRTTFGKPHHRDMGYYDEDGHYHSFRHGLSRAADKVLHPIHGGRHHHHDREEVVIEDREVTVSAPRRSGGGRSGRAPNTITIPCHHIRIGDLLILQGRPCQVIRITTSAHTGQHRYLGVDLFTKQLHEESSFISNPSPSVVVQNMLGPVFKQYRVLDIRDDGRVVAMTETGDVKQGLPVLDQSSLLGRIEEAFAHGRGSVRVLVLSDEGRELAVDYKVLHGSRL
ncbi:hypothetical protein K461DRAFT_291845 [Myriangium duriaei CBS 260.36]|uniref:Translation elongation factor IF5A C-terminal domain-containing protein n=1 Tax=Myriangium duriaei CBS 260.36 TaxID=1168546 RepID=A0A9P4MJ52_9PEZI|nr:hypothetical protein K461DRAFT_291845 [Myriangium duriaei CBS 260.36]